MESSGQIPDGATFDPATYQMPKELGFIADTVAPLFGDLASLIADFESNEDRVHFLAGHLESRSEEFTALVKKLRKSADELPLESCIRLLGPKVTQDFLIAEKLKTRIEGKSLDWEKLTQSPAQFCQSVIPFALKTREQFGEDSRYQFTAFLGGLVYDVLSTLNAKSGVDLARTKRLIQDEYDLGLEVGKLGLKEGRHIKALALEKYLVSAVLLKRSGRVIFSIMNKDYADFLKLVIKKGLRSNVIHVAEKKRYGVSSNVISAYLCRFVPGLQLIAPALLFYDYPFMLKDTLTSSDHYELVRHCVDLAMKLSGSARLKSS